MDLMTMIENAQGNSAKLHILLHMGYWWQVMGFTFYCWFVNKLHYNVNAT